MEVDEHTEIEEVPPVDNLEHYFNGVDAEAIEALSNRYAGFADPERIAALADVPTEFQSQADIDERFGLESPSGVLGYTEGSENPAHVSREQLEIPETVYHERLHQLSHPDSRELLGELLDEGITEALAQDALGVQEANLHVQAYTLETHIAREIMAECSEDAILNAYFRGETEAIESCLTERFGEDAMDRLREGAREWNDGGPA